MPIRFTCPYCERLLSISRRKIGQVIECPLCRGQVGVPAVDGSFPGSVAPALAPPPPLAPTLPADHYTLSMRRAFVLLLLAAASLVLAFVVGVVLGRHVL